MLSQQRRRAVSFWQFLNQRWNLPYLVMLGLVAVYFAVQGLGLVGRAGDADADAAGPGDARGPAPVSS